MTTSQKLAQKFNELPISKFRIKSKSEPGKFHIVELFNDGRLECDCPAGCFRKIECRHIKIVKNHIAKCQVQNNKESIEKKA